MTDPTKIIRDPELRHVDAALRRAAARARELGLQTNTPVWIMRDGKMIDLTAEAKAKQHSSTSIEAKPELP